MSRKHGPWTINETTEIYRHTLIEVFEDQVIKPDGQPGTYATVKAKAGASVLALDADGFVYLAREFRYAIGRESIEVVGGAIDEGETPSDAALRELKEELGIEACELIELGHADPITSIVDSPSHLFLARRLKFREKEQEGSEAIETVKVSLDEALRMVMSNEITHATSGVLIVRANHYLQQRKE